jgi:anaerobic magnesium-protoporphyrin IX monomethyl ester cyclase
MAHSRKTFVLIYNDQWGRVRSYSSNRSTGVPLQKVTSLREFLGLDEDEFSSLKYAFSEHPIWSSRPIFANATFLTTAAVMTILDRHTIPTRAYGESTLVDARVHLHGLTSEDVIAIGISTTFIFDDKSLDFLIHKAKQLVPGVPIIVGGAGITLNPDWFEKTGADFCITGDAEIALPELLNRLEFGHDFTDIPNLAWRVQSSSPLPGVGQQVRRNPRDNSISLDVVPTPRWDLTTPNGKWPESIFYESLRGCPFKCKFCSYPQQSPVWRVKTAERMAEEFAYYASQGVRYIMCLDSTMLTPIARMRKFTQFLIELGTPILWGCWAHPSQVQDPELCRMLYRSGCRIISIGIESGSEQILDNMAKHISTQKALRAIDNLRQSGLYVHTNYIIGFPGETPETARETVNFIKRAQADSYTLQAFQVRDRLIPIMAEAESYQLSIHLDEQGNYEGWSHAEMNSDEAEKLVRDAQRELILSCQSIISFALLASGTHYAPRLNEDTRDITYRRNNITQIVKEYERYLFAKPSFRLLGSGHKSYKIANRHRELGRAFLREELSNGRLISSAGPRRMRARSKEERKAIEFGNSMRKAVFRHTG